MRVCSISQMRTMVLEYGPTWLGHFYGFYVPSGKHSYWKWPFIVDCPINSMVIFHSYVNVYQRVGVYIPAPWFASGCCENHQKPMEGIIHPPGIPAQDASLIRTLSCLADAVNPYKTSGTFVENLGKSDDTYYKWISLKHLWYDRILNLTWCIVWWSFKYKPHYVNEHV